MLCVKCNTHAEKEDKYCIKCGSIIQPQPQCAPVSEDNQRVIPRNTCPNCDTQFETGDAFCLKCGQSIVCTTDSDVNPTTIIEPEPQKVNSCCKCKKPSMPEDIFCLHCGTKLAGEFEKRDNTVNNKKARLGIKKLLFIGAGALIVLAFVFILVSFKGPDGVYYRHDPSSGADCYFQFKNGEVTSVIADRLGGQTSRTGSYTFIGKKGVLILPKTNVFSEDTVSFEYDRESDFIKLPEEKLFYSKVDSSQLGVNVRYRIVQSIASDYQKKLDEYLDSTISDIASPHGVYVLMHESDGTALPTLLFFSFFEDGSCILGLWDPKDNSTTRHEATYSHGIGSDFIIKIKDLPDEMHFKFTYHADQDELVLQDGVATKLSDDPSFEYNPTPVLLELPPDAKKNVEKTSFFNPDGSIFPDSSERELTIEEILAWRHDPQVLSESQRYNISLELYVLGFARNEIYARNGHKFSSSQMYHDHFSKCNWYHNSGEVVPYNILNAIERTNVDMIAEREKAAKLLEASEDTVQSETIPQDEDLSSEDNSWLQDYQGGWYLWPFSDDSKLGSISNEQHQSQLHLRYLRIDGLKVYYGSVKTKSWTLYTDYSVAHALQQLGWNNTVVQIGSLMYDTKAKSAFINYQSGGTSKLTYSDGQITIHAPSGGSGDSAGPLEPWQNGGAYYTRLPEEFQ